MIFWIFMILLCVGIGLWVVGTRKWNSDKHPWLYYNDDTIDIIGFALTIVMVVVLLIMGTFIFIEHNESESKLAILREREIALTYKLESGSCRDEFGLLSKSVIDEIQNWNEECVRLKNLQNNFWTGIFYADIYDEFEPIDYYKYKIE